MSDFVDVKVGSRFVFVNLLPSMAFVVLVGGLIAAGAPHRAPTWHVLDSTVRSAGLLGSFLGIAVVVITSIVLHPLSYLIVQMLEGYWERLPGGIQAQRWIGQRYERWRRQLQAELRNKERSGAGAELGRLPPIGTPIRPTRLGNTLVAGEVRAGRRYGYDTAILMPRLMPVLSPTIRDELTDARNQLDAVARLSVVSLLGVPITLVLLWRHVVWLLVPFGCYLFAWMAYNAAIAAAQRFNAAVFVAVDYHRLQVWDSMSMPRPASVEQERGGRARLMSRLLLDGQVSREDLGELSFVGTDMAAGDGAAAGEQTDAGERGSIHLSWTGRGRRWLIQKLGGQVGLP